VPRSRWNGWVEILPGAYSLGFVAKNPTRVTAADVARLAGCSIAAVSLWANGKTEGRLTKEWSDRIADAVAQLGWVPNRVAQHLSTGTSVTVGFIFPGFSYNFFGSILEGVSSVLGSAWDLTFFDSRAKAEHGGSQGVIARAAATSPAGLILASPSQSELDELRVSSVPTVVIDSPQSPEGSSLVFFDVEPSVAEMAEDLARHGHRTVAYASFAAGSLSLRHRREVVQETLRRHGVHLVDNDLITPSLAVEDVSAAFESHWPTWVAAGVTAVICSDDRQAYGVIRGCRRLGIDLPEGLSIIGFNDSDAAPLLEPALSSIWLPAQSIGVDAAKVLRVQIAGEKTTQSRIGTRYTHRASLAAARIH
jgi:LacI family transcriptional regulator